MRFKRFLLSLVMLISCFCLVSCGKKSDDTGETPAAEKQEPVISVDINRTLKIYEGDKLNDIRLFFTNDGHTEGDLDWEDGDYVLVRGENNCKWVFTPTDTSKYKTKTGTIKINALEALIKPEVNDVALDYTRKVNDVTIDKVYLDAKLSTIGLTCATNVPNGCYTIDWVNPDQTFTADVDEYEWVFTPSDDSGFKQVTGTITVDTSNLPAQTLSKIELVSTLSGYRAFDRIDENLEIRRIYNAGKTENVIITKDDYTISYKKGDCLHQGDTSFTINYDGITCDFAVSEVGYFIVPKPSQTSDVLVYDGTSQELKVNSGAYYSVVKKFETNAGEYDVTLKIDDDYQNDCRWADDDESLTTTVKCEIKKADLQLTENNYSGSYDGNNYSASVTGTGVEKVYYHSTVALNEDNYLTAEGAIETPIEKNKAGTYTIYYFAKGDKNHNNKSGTLQVEIKPITPTMTLANCYSLYTGSAVNYPANYVTVTGQNEELIPTTASDLTFEYFYDSELTQKLSSAPTSVRNTEYYVKVTYIGDGQNIGEVSKVAKLFIDNVNNGLYAQTGEKEFAFNGEIYTSDELAGSSLTGSNKECTKYLEFKVLPVSDGIVGLGFSLKLAAGNENVKEGKLIYDNGYVLLCDDGVSYNFKLSEDMLIIDEDTTLNKWVLPDYLGTYSAQTVSDEDYNAEKNNGTKNSEITIYNDYGTIRFIARFNVKYVDTSENFGGVGSASGGYSEVQGVAKCGTELSNRKSCYSLKCYVTGSSKGYSESSNYFTMVWLINGDGGVELVDNGYLALNKLSGVITTTDNAGVVTNISYTKKTEN